MNVASLTYEQRTLAVQRLTGLWAFTESGLGGVLHALQLPFTGLIVGGIAVMLITLIGWFSERNLSAIFKSLLVVLIVKAAVSPHTPFPAYIAVSFQAVIGFLLFFLLRVNVFSIMLLSILAMVESAIQKLLILTFFFGSSIWKAADELVNYVAKQFSISASSGSWWMVGMYVTIYVVGGSVIGLMTGRLIHKLETSGLDQAMIPLQVSSVAQANNSRKRRKIKLIFVVFTLSVISIILYFFSDSTANAKLTISQAFAWTASAVVLWYVVITPLFRKALLWVLQKKKSKYSVEVGEALSFIPIFHKLSYCAWKASAGKRGLFRFFFFVYTLISWALVYTESESSTKVATTFP